MRLSSARKSLGDFENIQISNSEVGKARLAGIGLYSVDGAHLHGVTLDHITMQNVGVPINVRLGSRLKTFRPGDLPKPPGSVSDIVIKNVQVTNALQIGILINGIPRPSCRACRSGKHPDRGERRRQGTRRCNAIIRK